MTKLLFKEVKEMKKIRVLFFTVFIVLLLVAFLVSCANKAASDNKTPGDSSAIGEISPEEEQPDVFFPEKGSSGQLASGLFSADDFSDDLQELFDQADAVVLGTVVKDDVQYKSEGSGLEHALSDLRAEKVWKGDINEDDAITVHEIGWRYEDGRTVSLGGEPVLQNGMKVVLFLGPPRDGERWIKNSFQGKFIVDGQGIVHSYEYFSDDNEFSYLDDVGETVPLTDFAATLDGLAEK